ncbi:MAG: glycerate kinase [Myxococcota bacterium]
MRVVAALASFKGTLSARVASEIVASATGGEAVPVADGGEGTLDVLALPTTRVRARDPWGAWREVDVGVADGWVIELAKVCGHDARRRDVMRASTAGVGDVVRAGLAAGVRRFTVTLGGSATCDGGAGFLHALGADCPNGPPLDARPFVLPHVGAELVAVCDVDAPLSDAARLYAPQKGATPADVVVLEAALARWAELLGVRDAPGAAGGLAVALRALGARTVRGAPWVCDRVGLDAAIARAGVVVTGEGSVDAQTLQGKAPFEVARRAHAAGVPVVVIAGRVAAALPGVVRAIELGPPTGDAAGVLSAAARGLVPRAL